MKRILKENEWGDRAKSMYKLENYMMSYKCVYTVYTVSNKTDS